MSVIAACFAQSPVTEYPLPVRGCPYYITAGPNGALWFTDPCGNTIGQITTSGNITQYSIPTVSSYPTHIITGPDGALWFTEYWAGKIGRLTMAGAFTEYALLDKRSNPYGITAGPDGALWFTDEYNGKVGRITTTGSIAEYPIPTPSNPPDGIVSGPDGALWFIELGYSPAVRTARVGRSTTDGHMIEYPIPTDAIGTTDVNQEIAAGPDGALWFTQYSNNIGRITTDGRITEFTTPTARSVPYGITVGPDGALWFTENSRGQIGRVTPAGCFSEYAIPSAALTGLELVGIASGPDGALWFTEYAASRIGRLDPMAVPAQPLSVTLTSSPNPSQLGQAVTLVANVCAGGTAAPTGTVTFTSGATLGTAPLSGSTASLIVNSLSAGTHTITATYSGDLNFGGSTSPPITQSVQGGASVAVSSSTNPSNIGQAVTFTVMVAGAPPSFTPTGFISLLDGGAALANVGLNSGGLAQYTTSSLAAGSHSITAVYSGDSNFAATTSPVLTQVVQKQPTTTTVASSVNPSSIGQAITFTAAVAVTAPGTGTPTGTVAFKDGLTILARVSLTASGSAAYTTSSLAAGPHSITAVYSGDTNFQGSTSAVLTQGVGNNGGGVGCACGLTGNYKDPAPAVDNNPISPDGRFSVAAHIDNTANTDQLVVTLTSNGTVVLDTGPLPITVQWGFSPDGGRFAYHFLSGTNNGTDNVFVYDLTSSPARLLVQLAPSISGSRLQFSPSGRYFLYTALLGQSSEQVNIFRIQGVTAQTPVYQTNFNFAVGSGQDSFGAVSWGFSPDNPESSFVYGYVSGQGALQWNVVNLVLAKQVLSIPITAVAAFWQFDPCGDVIGLVTQVSVTQDDVALFSAATGQSLGDSGALPSLSVTLLTASAGQEVQYSGQTVIVASTCHATPVPAGQISTTASGLAYSRVSQTYNGTVTLKNISAAVVPGPFQLVLSSLTSGVTPANATGSINGVPYLTVTGAASLAPGQSATVNLQFRNPANAAIGFTAVIYSGSF